jgi:hypothetical protein
MEPRKIYTRRQFLKATLLKADMAWHFDEHNRPARGDRPITANHRGYHHKAHDEMFTRHVKDKDRQTHMTRDAYEQANHGATHGHIAATAMQHTVDDFVERLQAAKSEEEISKVVIEMHDWLSYVHAQHPSHDLHKDQEFRRAYAKAHKTHTGFVDKQKESKSGYPEEGKNVY